MERKALKHQFSKAMKAVPMEDTIEALLDYFVSPLLSIRESSGKPPSDHQQAVMAKQLNAVVVLYNYYHRKQFADLEFLDFKTFFKICCISKPSLLQYLSYMHTCEEDPENTNIQYSLTEKKVIDSCNLCLELDSCKKYQVMDAWPISKVAVFLVDSKKEKCVLLRSHATQGVWSIVEKELADPDYKFLQSQSCQSEKVLEKLAFSAVETDTGISCKNLLILEHHLTYSSNFDKASTWLYIMKYEGVLSMDITEVFIEDIKTSMEGPIVWRDSTCEITPVVEYYSILPYRETISSWVSREKNGRQVDAYKKVSLDFTEDHNTKTQYVKPSQNGTIIKMDEKTPSLVDIKAAIEVEGSAELNAEKDRLMNHMDLPKEKNIITACNKENQSKDETVPYIEESIGADKGPEDKADENHDMSNISIPDEQNLDPRSSSLNEIETITVNNDLIEVPLNDKSSSATDSCMLVDTYHISTDKDNELNKPTSSNNLTSSTNELRRVAYGSDLSNDGHMQTHNNTMQASLGILRKKLNELHQRKQLLEDEIAWCEMNIQTILKEGENSGTSVFETVVGGASLCSKQMQNNLDSSSGERNTSLSIKRRKLPEAVPSSRNYCQELDDICHRNNWMLPRYKVIPCYGDHDITGAFEATVELHGKGLDFRSDGDKKSSPGEARQSAASRILSKLRT